MEIEEAIENMKMIISTLKLSIIANINADISKLQVESYETILMYLNSHMMFEDLKKEEDHGERD